MTNILVIKANDTNMDLEKWSVTQNYVPQKACGSFGIALDALPGSRRALAQGRELRR